jgi:FkbM family methyltransferase
METFNTEYGIITLYRNDSYIIGPFLKGSYWDKDLLVKMKEIINPNRNILEIGGHCGTTTLAYASFLNDDKKIYVFEPQKKLFDLLLHNISQNSLQHKVFPVNKGVFAFTGKGEMNDIDIDGEEAGCLVQKRYEEENMRACNFGGISLGTNGEKIDLIMVDDMELEDIGLIHCDAQGSESFIFSKAVNTIRKHRPIILFEDDGGFFHKRICNLYPNLKEESTFDLTKFCMEELKYSYAKINFDGNFNNLLIP